MFNIISKFFKSEKKKNTIGLALGGGGARGLAHIGFLKVLDQLSIKPSMITGTSIGAMIGALYCSGFSADEIEMTFSDLNLFKWSRLLDISWISRKGFIKGERIVKLFESKLKIKNFEDLPIPLKVIATDFWKRREVVFKSGDILEAVRASISIPGIFEPIKIGDVIYTDGGAVNPLPYDHLLDTCNFIIAIDVSGSKRLSDGKTSKPSILDGIISTYTIMEESIINNKLKMHKPDIYIKPELLNVDLLEFHKKDEILQIVENDMVNFKQKMITKFGLKTK